MTDVAIYILGINGSARASAAILKDGQIMAAALEERFTRVKNQSGYPKNAIDYCLKEAGIDSSNLTSVWIGFLNPTLFLKERDYKRDQLMSFLSKIKPYFTNTAVKLSTRFPRLYDLYELRKHTPFWKLLEPEQKKYVASRLNLPIEKINMLDHHWAHGFAAYYSNPSLPSNSLSLVITLDGAGDGVCSRIFTIKNHNWREIASTSNDYTLGWLYEYVTQYLGMKPNEDEYQVMGLAPYAQPNDVEKVYQIFKELMWLEGLSIKSSIPRVAYPSFIRKKLASFRFDAIAGGIQKLTEELTIQLVQNALKKTGIHSVVLGGGVFMNVKANMKIAQLKEVSNLWVCPSSTDDSTALGAAYFGYSLISPTSLIPPNNLYLGPSYPSAIPRNPVCSIKKLKNPAKQIAKLLASGHIVARFAGRMEYGARALGNRSILADPRDIKVIKIINFMIKGRDFWMPFAPTILYEDRHKYLINPKDIDSPYMMLAFETTLKAQKEIPATLHPYDLTCRPQILKKEDNPQYYQIIYEFKKQTGVGAILNTSFNLHGQPIVCTLKDAIDTFLKSGLKYLVIEDYLISKN